MKKTSVPRIGTLKQKFANYRDAAQKYIVSIKYPNQQLAFSVRGYEVTPTGKKPNLMSAPELLAFVSTATKLGKYVQVTASGVGDGALLNFYFVDIPPVTPLEVEWCNVV
jgi:hypothetical protein